MLLSVLLGFRERSQRTRLTWSFNVGPDRGRLSRVGSPLTRGYPGWRADAYGVRFQRIALKRTP